MEKIKVKRGRPIIKKLLKIIGSDKAYIMGGFARYACSTRKKADLPGDIDIYCYDQTVFDSMVAKLESIGLERWAKENPVCVMYKKSNLFAGMQIQLVKPITDFNLKTEGTLEDILNNFDFTVCRIGLINQSKALADDDFLKDEKKKRLVVKFIHCPVSSSIRFMKYAKKGYTIRPREVFKLFQDWDKRDITYKTSIYELFDKADKKLISDVEIVQLERLLRRD